MPRHLLSHFGFIACCLFLTGAWQEGLWAAQPNNAGNQFVQNAVQAGRGTLDPDVNGIFLPVERTASRRIIQAKELIDEARYSEAVKFLGTILDADEDWFFRSHSNRSRYSSLKAEAHRMLAELPEQGYDAYQLVFGGRAQNLLKTAIQESNPALLAEVSRRFFHTTAGYQATALLARHYLDHGRPLAAALAYQQLLDTPRAKGQLGSSLWLQAAISWQLAGKKDRAIEILHGLQRQVSAQPLVLGGRKIPRLSARHDDPLTWLEQTVGHLKHVVDAPTEAWTMHRGNARRNAQTHGSQPLLTPRWRVRTVNDPWIEETLDRVQQTYSREGHALLPTVHPLAIGDVVLMRTLRNLLAIDFATGKRIWEVKPGPDDALQTLFRTQRGANHNNQLPRIAFGLEKRVWDDAAYGTLSSDGTRVYSLEGLRLLPNTQMAQAFGRFQGSSDRAGTTYNRLTAHELATQGKLVWEVGGPDSQNQDLIDAFFLSPPLPLDGFLYALVEQKGGIRLVVLEASSGKLTWSQQLADVERNISQDPFRRLAGATPSFSDGVLVCPTSAGAVVAIDLANRSLLWAFKYPQRYTAQQNRAAQLMMRGYPTNLIRSNDRWCDSSVTITNGRVLLTPTEADQIYCLDLIDGRLLWKQDRGKNYYLACVHQDRAILVGAQGLTALRLDNGRPAWTPSRVPLPEQSLPSGRGFYSEHSYFVPLTTAAVAQVDLNRGRITSIAKSRTGQVPGNLICHRGQIISQRADVVEKFFQLEPLEAWIAQTLKTDASHPEGLLRQGQVLLERGDIVDAIGCLRKAWQSIGARETPPAVAMECRHLYVQSLLEGLELDFDAHRSAIPEALQLVDHQEEKAHLLRVIADGLSHSGDRLEAFRRYLEIARLAPLDESGLERVALNLSVQRSRWIQFQLAQLFQAATKPQQEEMRKLLDQELLAHSTSVQNDELRMVLRHFAPFQQTQPLKLRWLEHLLRSESYLEAELALLDLEKSPDQSDVRPAVALLARLYRKQGRLREASRYYHRLRHEFAQQVCLNGLTGTQICNALAHHDRSRIELAAKTGWLPGSVDAQVDPNSTRQASYRQQLFPLEIAGRRSAAFSGAVLALDQPRQQVRIADADGQPWFQTSLQATDTRRTSFYNAQLNYARTHGHLVVLSMGYRLMAIDALNSQFAGQDHILWQVDLSEQVFRRTHRAIQAQRLINAGGQSSYRATDANGHRIGTIGPLLSSGITYQHNDQVICVDPITGEQQWIRDAVRPGSELFGDDLAIVVVHATDHSALLLDPVSGAELATGKIPPASQRIANYGRLVLYQEVQGQQRRLIMLDPLSDQQVWSKTINRRAKTWVVENDEIGILEPTGHFTIVALRDGETRVTANVLPEPRLANIVLLRSSQQYHLLTNRVVRRSQAGEVVSSARGGRHHMLLTGRVYAFDRATGKLQWPIPATITRQGLVLPQPADLPALVFVNRITKTSLVGNRKQGTTSVLCLDKRTGRKIFHRKDFPFETPSYRLAGDRSAQTLTLTLPQTAVTLRFSNQSLAPEPPAQEDGSETRRPSKTQTILGILGSIPKALAKAANNIHAPIGLDEQEDALHDLIEGAIEHAEDEP